MRGSPFTQVICLGSHAKNPLNLEYTLHMVAVMMMMFIGETQTPQSSNHRHGNSDRQNIDTVV
jgi:hypothetical protein